MKLPETNPGFFARGDPCPLSSVPSPLHLLVIAYGNTLRRDDGAGVGLAGILVKQWRAHGVCVRYLVVPQLTPELAIDIADPAITGIVFVDAAAIKDEPGIQLRSLQVGAVTPAVSHHVNPTILLMYAHLLYARSVPAWMITVSGLDFGYGEGFSERVRALLNNAPDLAVTLLMQIVTSNDFANQPACPGAVAF